MCVCSFVCLPARHALFYLLRLSGISVHYIFPLCILALTPPPLLSYTAPSKFWRDIEIESQGHVVMGALKFNIERDIKDNGNLTDWVISSLIFSSK